MAKLTAEEIHQILEDNTGERTRCEVYSRIVGYHRPVANWNAGKQQEWRDRALFDEVKGLTNERRQVS